MSDLDFPPSRLAARTDHPEPDRKDWLWVLQRGCTDCGADVSRLTAAELADRVEAAAGEWVQVLDSPIGYLDRPQPRVWSPLEYGAHVRDFMLVTTDRVTRTLLEPQPALPAWDQNAAALDGAYLTLDPQVTADEVEECAETFLKIFAELAEADLGRTASAAGAELSVLMMGRYLLHDWIHHLWDVTGQTDVTEQLLATIAR